VVAGPIDEGEPPLQKLAKQIGNFGTGRLTVLSLIGSYARSIPRRGYTPAHLSTRGFGFTILEAMPADAPVVCRKSVAS